MKRHSSHTHKTGTRCITPIQINMEKKPMITVGSHPTVSVRIFMTTPAMTIPRMTQLPNMPITVDE